MSSPLLPRVVFKCEIRDNRIIFRASSDFSDENLRVAASQIPIHLDQPSSLTREEDAALGYTALDHLPRYLHQDEYEDLIYQFFSEDRLHRLDIVEELKVIQQLLLKHFTGTVRTNQVLLSSVAFENPRLVERISIITTLIIDAALDQQTKSLLTTRCYSEASLCVGSDLNKYTSSIVVDFRSEHRGVDIADKDDPCRYSVILNLSQVPADHFPSRICLPTFKEYCVLAPFTALVLKRCIPHAILDPKPYAPDAMRYTSPVWVKPGTLIPLKLVSFPAFDCMRNSPEAAVSLRSSGNSLGLFGTLRNYTEWSLSVFVVEAHHRSKENSVFSLPDAQDLVAVFRLKGCQDADQPRPSIVGEVCAALDAGSVDWIELERRMKLLRLSVASSTNTRPSFLSIHHPTNLYRTWTHTRVADSLVQASEEAKPEAQPTLFAALENGIAAAVEIIAVPRNTSEVGVDAPTTSQPSIAAALGTNSQDLNTENTIPQVAKAASGAKSTHGNTAEESAILATPNINPPVEALQNAIPPSPDETVSSQHQEPSSTDTLTPCSSFKFNSPVWNPKAGLTQRLADSIASIFSIESITSFTKAYQQYSQKSLTMPQYPSDLESQLQMHLHVLSHGNSLLHDYEQLVSRAAICQIIHQAPNMRDAVIEDVMRCDRLQRLRLQLSSPINNKKDSDAFWKDFLDRNALLCEIVQNIGSVILVAPGLYELILTAGGSSISSSAIRSSLQPATRSRIVQLCLWQSRHSKAFMKHLNELWQFMFPDTPSNSEPPLIKLPQHIEPLVPSVGPCFPPAFQVLHQIIDHAVDHLSSNSPSDDVIWGRFLETDRMACIREATASMRCLYKAKLDRSSCKAQMAQTVFRNILCIRTLFFGNSSKLRAWRRFESADAVCDLVEKSSQFEELYGNPRVYGQYQFPTSSVDFKRRLATCWTAPWPLASGPPSWAQVYSAASNAEGAGELLRSFIASDMARLGWCSPPEASDWPFLLTPNACAALDQLFPSSPKKQHVDPLLAEVVAVSLSAKLTQEKKNIIGFDRIFVEHILSRFTLYLKEGLVVDAERRHSHAGRKRKRAKGSD
ncbi:hypothetical protein L207DRAFT_520540 [Hyaloscypha variabilis F]|uniref:Uncharacterized protein n=1 Tax=Hyaloscypha variabilis (strain UAMH 11265 / GT02V1 / F) TaxID=1149755 RepID=A0A2J6QUE6_HYAVF|nr:hypothetical protein L207DRAFT_520540 [Hyaloscypha variabilis F]